MPRFAARSSAAAKRARDDDDDDDNDDDDDDDDDGGSSAAGSSSGTVSTGPRSCDSKHNPHTILTRVGGDTRRRGGTRD
jgi:hypothetical protein